MDIKKIGDRIKKARIDKKMSVSELANKIGVNKATISRYENGLFNKIKLPIIQSIAILLNVNPIWLIDGEGPEEITSNQSNMTIIEINKILEILSQNDLNLVLQFCKALNKK